MANHPTKLALRRLIVKNNPDFLFIYEPWMDYANFPQNWFYKLGLKLISVNCRPNSLPNLWRFCKLALDHVVILIGEQHMAFNSSLGIKTFGFIVVYVSTSYLKRRLISPEISSIIYSHKIPWNILGDFIMVFGAHEHLGTSSPPILPIQDFQDWTNLNDLIHLPTIEAYFTWSNGSSGTASTLKRLD